MSCNFPIRAYRCEDGEVVFEESKGAVVREILLPCGRCEACMNERARSWSVRCVHEASLHEQNCFITLTYNDDHLPDMADLKYEDFQKFMKRLRKKYTGRKIRFFACGEYGENRQRPHFHACIFGIDFNDRIYFKTTSAGSKIYTSKTLDALWSDRSGNSIGFASIGDISINSAGYVARYVMKKAFGRENDYLYDVIDIETGETYRRTKEFNKMSLKPGIGYGFYKKWRSDIFPADHCVIDGREIKPPKYYYKKLADEDKNVYNLVQDARELKAIGNAGDNSEPRREVKEKVLKARGRLFKRELL